MCVYLLVCVCVCVYVSVCVHSFCLDRVSDTGQRHSTLFKRTINHHGDGSIQLRYHGNGGELFERNIPGLFCREHVFEVCVLNFIGIIYHPSHTHSTFFSPPLPPHTVFQVGRPNRCV